MSDASDFGAAAPFASLVARELATAQDMEAAAKAWREEGVRPEVHLRQRLRLSRQDLRQALADYYNLPALPYDECLPIPEDLAQLAHGASGPKHGLWFPVCRENNLITFAISAPNDPEALQEIERLFPDQPKRFMACLGEEVSWYAQDFAFRDVLRGPVGGQRTVMAFWRNTMALWRTKLACQRTNLAAGRTWLNIMRWSLGLVAMGNTLLRMGKPAGYLWGPWLAVVIGLVLAGISLSFYLRLRRTWRHLLGSSLVEATSAVLHFLEEYDVIELPTQAGATAKQTMLGRLGDRLTNYSTITLPRGGYRERITLARERNVLAAQRTILACYRNIASQARTGLAFLRTGATITSFGLGLLTYFGLDIFSVLDWLLVLIGVAMTVDGAAWYWPVRGEYSETPRCVRLEYDDD
jgi:uncharacterized membrane protein YidH (DUF202 family)